MRRILKKIFLGALAASIALSPTVSYAGVDYTTSDGKNGKATGAPMRGSWLAWINGIGWYDAYRAYDRYKVFMNEKGLRSYMNNSSQENAKRAAHSEMMYNKILPALEKEQYYIAVVAGIGYNDYNYKPWYNGKYKSWWAYAPYSTGPCNAMAYDGDATTFDNRCYLRFQNIGNMNLRDRDDGTGHYFDRNNGKKYREIFNFNIKGNEGFVDKSYYDEALKSGMEKGTVNCLNNSTLYWWKKGGHPVDGIGIYTVEKTKKERKVVIKKTTGTGNDFDHSDETTEWLYNYGRTTSNYRIKTKPEKTSQSDKVTATLVTINKEYKVKYDYKTGKETLVSKPKYIVEGGDRTFTRNFNYRTETPEFTQEYYRPLVLNKNGYVSSSDRLPIDKKFVDADKKIEAEINNGTGTSDTNKKIETLDVNNDTRFKFKFKNSYFGLDPKFKWNNKLTTLSNGTWEETRKGSSYANGRNSIADSDGNIRCDTTFYASIGGSKVGNTSSLSINGVEKTSNEGFVKTLSGTSFDGGTFSARFSYADNYFLDNNVFDNDPNFGKWWLIRYNMSKFIEYGTEYAGTIDTNGINDPYEIKCGKGTRTGSDYQITVDANKKDRGLYVGATGKSFKQPVLYGSFHVKTIAGSTL